MGNLAPIARIKELLLGALKKDIELSQIVEMGLRRGLEIIGEKYEAGEYFLSELLYGSEMMEVAFDTIKPYLKSSSMKAKGTILTATVRGDLHDIGKNVFKMFAEASGYD